MDNSTDTIDSSDESNESKRTRSPAYPAIGLREAVDITKSILEIAGGHRFDEVSSDAISERLGLKENGSVFRVKMSALKKFDLVDEIRTDQWRLTSWALIILDETTSEPEYTKTLKRIALRPAIYEILYQKTKNRPSRFALKFYLHQQKFNPKVVNGVINDFADSMVYAGLISPDDARKLHPPESSSPAFDQENISRIQEIVQQCAEVLNVDANDPIYQRILERSALNSIPSVDATRFLELSRHMEAFGKSVSEAIAKIQPLPQLNLGDSLTSQLPATPLPPTALPSTHGVIPATPTSAPAAPLPPRPPLVLASDTLQIPVGEGRFAIIPYPMDEASYDILMETLRLWKPKIVSAKPDEKKNA